MIPNPIDPRSTGHDCFQTSSRDPNGQYQQTPLFPTRHQHCLRCTTCGPYVRSETNYSTYLICYAEGKLKFMSTSQIVALKCVPKFVPRMLEDVPPPVPMKDRSVGLSRLVSPDRGHLVLDPSRLTTLHQRPHLHLVSGSCGYLYITPMMTPIPSLEWSSTQIGDRWRWSPSSNYQHRTLRLSLHLPTH